MSTKTCTRCQEDKPITAFNLCAGRLHSHCRICRNATALVYQKKRYAVDASYKDKARNNVKACQSKPEYKTRRNITAQIRRKTDINFTLRARLRSRIWDALKGNIKSGRTFTLLGCDLEQLKLHLSSLFNSGMTWDNYGLWHIDHIKPCVSFDFSLPTEQAKCFHYSNLQPLWGKDNLKKGTNTPSMTA